MNAKVLKLLVSVGQFCPTSVLCIQYFSGFHRNGMVGERGTAQTSPSRDEQELSDEQNKLHKRCFDS